MSPIYDFICQNPKCEHEFLEVYLSWNDDTSRQMCLKCGEQAKKIPSTNARMSNWSLWNAMG